MPRLNIGGREVRLPYGKKANQSSTSRTVGQVLSSNTKRAVPNAYPRNPYQQVPATVFPRNRADVSRNVRDLPASILALFSPLIGARRYGSPMQMPQAQPSTPPAMQRYQQLPRTMGPTEQEIADQQRRQRMLNMIFGR